MEATGRNSAAVVGVKAKGCGRKCSFSWNEFWSDQSRLPNGCRYPIPILWLSRLSLRLPDRA